MKKGEIIKLCKKYATSITKFNTNNAWGFGGGIGIEYRFSNNYAIRIGRACYRHLPDSAFITLVKYIDDCKNYVSENKKTIKEFIEALDKQ